MKFPTLRSIRLLQISASNTGEGKDSLKADVGTEFNLSILNADANVEIIRIAINIIKSGKWFIKNEKKEVCNYVAGYKALFYFSKDISIKEVVNFMSDESYRNMLIAQVMPTITNNMRTHLDSMGITATITNIGYKPEGGKWNEISKVKKATKSLQKTKSKK